MVYVPGPNRVLPQALLTLARQAPEICALYTLHVSPQFVRQQIRRRFEENRHVTDLRVLDHIILKGRQEYQETMNFWKQKDHVMGKLLAPRGRPPRTFLQRFYEGAWSVECTQHCAEFRHQAGTRTTSFPPRRARSYLLLRVPEFI